MSELKLEVFLFSDGVADGEIEWSTGRREEKWWSKMVKDEYKTSLELSGKLVLLFEILSMSEQIGDKVLVSGYCCCQVVENCDAFLLLTVSMSQVISYVD